MTYKLYRCKWPSKLRFLVSSTDFTGLTLRANIEADALLRWKQRNTVFYGYRTWESADPEFAISTHS